MPEKTYTLYELLKKKLVMKSDGTPYTWRTSILNRVRSLGFVPTKQYKGRLVYAFTEKDIKKLNTWKV